MSHSEPLPYNTLLGVSASPSGVPSEVYDAIGRPAETNLLIISYRTGPGEWLRDWRDRVGELPAEVGFLNVGEMPRSAATRSGASACSLNPGAAMPITEAISDPTDLATLGVRASEYLEAWDGNGHQTVVVLDSVTCLLEAVDLDRAFRFLHVLAGRVESVDGRAYHLLDPTVHDDRSVSTLREFADDAVGLGEPA